jgi:hypothetical protein
MRRVPTFSSNGDPLVSPTELVHVLERIPSDNLTDAELEALSRAVEYTEDAEEEKYIETKRRERGVIAAHGNLRAWYTADNFQPGLEWLNAQTQNRSF